MAKEDPTLKMYFREIKKFPVLDAQRELEVVTRIQEDDDKAREELILCNLRLVVSIAKKYTNCGIPLSDLIEEGNLGLLYAVERFRPEKNCRFSTYATFWIKHAVCKGLTEKNQLVKIPAYMKKVIAQFREYTEELSKQSQNSFSMDEISEFAKKTGSKQKIVREALMTNRAIEGLQSIQTINEKQDWIEDPKQPQVYKNLFEQSEFEWVLHLLEKMGQKRAQVIKMRYGLEGNPPQTLKEIAQYLGLTKERIRQIEKETIEMLRSALQTTRRPNKATQTA